MGEKNRRGKNQKTGMNKFRSVIAAVMLLREFFRKGEETECIYMYITCELKAKGCGLSRLKVDVSHVAC